MEVSADWPSRIRKIFEFSLYKADRFEIREVVWAAPRPQLPKPPFLQSMKKTILLLSAILTLPALPVFAQTSSVNPNDRVRVEVQVKSETERKDSKDGKPDNKTKTQLKTLDIKLSGKAKNPETRVAKWYIFGKNLSDNSTTILASGEEKVDLTTNGQQAFKSGTATATSSTDRPAPQRNRGKNDKPEETADPGSKYLGFGVQVKEGNVLLGEFLSGESIRPEMK